MKKVTKYDFNRFNSKDDIHRFILSQANRHPEVFDPEIYLPPRREINKKVVYPYNLPIYIHIRFPTGKYNFFHFNILMIKEICRLEIPTSKEKLIYLEMCRENFHLLTGDDPDKFVYYWIKPKPMYLLTGDKNINPEFQEKRREDKEQNKYCMDSFLEKLEKLIVYYKSLLAIETKYCIPSSGMDALDKVIQQKEKVIEPIQWLQSERQFSWLIEQLADQGYIKSENKWVNAAKHFINKNGKEFNADSLNSKASDNRDLPEKNLSLPLKKIHSIVKKIPSNKE